ncbi:MAG: glycosyltransferase family 4 protein [Candidatus Cloacimonetes bacterium]|nr:glycosyltransferase family 4 protein [Candidatus Cloacimonadota bacterium]
MRILVISNYYPPFFWGDYEPACKEMVDHLLKNNHKVYILTGNYGVPKRNSSKPELNKPCRILKYVNYENANSTERYLVDKFNFRATKQMIKQTFPDIVFIWNMKGISTAPVFAVQTMKIPRIFDIANLWPNAYILPGFASNIKRMLKRILPNTIGGKLDLNPSIVTSNWMAQSLKRRYGLKRSYVIPRGVMLPKNVHPKKQKQILEYIFVGRIDHNKKIEIALKALQLLKTKGKKYNFQFNLYGDVETSFLIKLQKTIHQLDLSENVHFKGKTENIDVVYKQSDITILPHLTQESNILIALESMAYKNSVVIPNQFGAAEIIEHNIDGLLFEPDNPESLYEQLISIHDNYEKRIEIGENAYRKISEKYEISMIEKKIEDILLQEVNKQKRKDQGREK